MLGSCCPQIATTRRIALRRTGEPQKCHKLTVPDTSALSGTPPAAVDPDGAAADPDGDALADPDVVAELDAAAELAGATADEDAAAELAGAAADEDADGAVEAPPPLAHAARVMLSTVNNVAIRHHEPCLPTFIAISFLCEPDPGRKSAVARADMALALGVERSYCTEHNSQ